MLGNFRPRWSFAISLFALELPPFPVSGSPGMGVWRVGFSPLLDKPRFRPIPACLA